MYDVAIATIVYPIGSHRKRYRVWFGDYGLGELKLRTIPPPRA